MSENWGIQMEDWLVDDTLIDWQVKNDGNNGSGAPGREGDLLLTSKKRMKENHQLSKKEPQ